MSIPSLNHSKVRSRKEGRRKEGAKEGRRGRGGVWTDGLICLHVIRRSVTVGSSSGCHPEVIKTIQILEDEEISRRKNNGWSVVDTGSSLVSVW